MSNQLHAPGRSMPGAHFDTGLSGTQSRSGRGGEEKYIPAPAGKRTPIVQSAAQSLY